MLARLATAASSPCMNSVTNSPGSAVVVRDSRVDLTRRESGILEREEEGVEGDLSSPDSRYRTFASPVISEMGWMGGSKTRRRDEEYGSIRLVDDGEEGSVEAFSTSGEGSREGSSGSRGSGRRRPYDGRSMRNDEDLGQLEGSPLPIFKGQYSTPFHPISRLTD